MSVIKNVSKGGWPTNSSKEQSVERPSRLAGRSPELSAAYFSVFFAGVESS